MLRREEPRTATRLEGGQGRAVAGAELLRKSGLDCLPAGAATPLEQDKMDHPHQNLRDFQMLVLVVKPQVVKLRTSAGTWTGLEYPLLVGGEESLQMARVSFPRSDFRLPGLPRIPGIFGIFGIFGILAVVGLLSLFGRFPVLFVLFGWGTGPVTDGSAGGLSSRR